MRVLVLLLALFVPRATLAASSVGVLVTGEYLKAPTQSQAEKWMRARGQRVVAKPMPKEAVKILLDCFVLDDPKCMRSIVEARSSTDSLVSIRVDIASKKEREVRLTIDWFVKGHSPVSSRRTCDDCTEATLRKTLDAMLDDLSRTAPGFMGRVKITSEPAGLTVLLDNATIGVTPLETDIAVGEHKLQLVRDGRTGPEKTITIDGKKLAEITLDAPSAAPIVGDVPPPPGRRSRLVPGLMIGIGVAGIGAGTALYLTSEEPTGQGRTYRDTKTLGIGVAAGGGALLITGVIIILATKSTTAPTVAWTPDGVPTLGWAGRF